MTREEKQKLCDVFIDKLEQQFIDFEKETNIKFNIFSSFEFDNLNKLFPHHELICKTKNQNFYYLPVTKIETETSIATQAVYGPNVPYVSCPKEV